jgi:CBS domain-containing protein
VTPPSAARPPRAEHLGDFTLHPRTVAITVIALAVGGASAVAAFCLLRLIGLITNVVFYQRVSFALTAPGARHHSPWLVLLAPVAGGLLAFGATALVYKSEDAFARLPVHWMWWPAIGGAIIGLGGLVEPRALGVGYDVIDQLLTGRAGLSLIVGILVVKTLIWSLSLGSGTSGGVLAPVFMIGGALGALEGHALPHVFAGFWAMAGLAAVVGGVMRSPFTGVVFTLELTHAWNTLLALLVASVSAYALSVLILKRSVLTEKVARRGVHLTREYSIDPLEVFFARDVMTPPEPGTPARLTAYADHTLREVANSFARHDVTRAAVAARENPELVIGEITLDQLLHARRRDLDEEERRERFLYLRVLNEPSGGGAGRLADGVPGFAAQPQRLRGGDQRDAAEQAERHGEGDLAVRRAGKKPADPQRDRGNGHRKPGRELAGGGEQRVGVPHLPWRHVGEADRAVDGEPGRPGDPADQGQPGDDRQRGGRGGEPERRHDDRGDDGRGEQQRPEAEPVDQRRGGGLDAHVAGEDEQDHRA